MSDDKKIYDLTRRKVLGSIGALGVGAAVGGAGTAAFFSDEETFENNRLVAGELDLKVDWEEHYNFPQIYGWEDPAAGLDVTRSAPDPSDDYTPLPDPENPMVWVHDDDLDDYMANTAIEAFPDPDNDGEQEVEAGDFTYVPCDDGADLDEHLVPDGDSGIGRTDNADTTDGNGDHRPLVHLEDVKPGDFGELTLSLHLCDNPGYIWLQGELVNEDGGVHTEPEAEVDPNNEANLAENIQTVWWFDDGDNVLERGDCEEKLYLTDHSNDIPARLYEVTFSNGNAVTSELVNLENEAGFIASHVASSPDGKTLYAVAELANQILAVDADDGSTVGPLDIVDQSGDPVEFGQITQAAVDTDGMLYIGETNTNNLIKISDPGNNPTVEDRISLDIDISGADNAFTSNGEFYLYTNSDQSLYTVNLISGTTAKVTTLGETLTGLAVSNAGAGDFIGSRAGTSQDVLVVFDENGSIVDEFDLAGDLQDDEGLHTAGDLTTGELCEQVIRRGTLKEDLAALSDGAGLPLDGGRCYQPGFTRHIGFAWWVPEGVENEIQGDSIEFDIGFYTEQCRHNDGPGMNETTSEPTTTPPQ